MPTTKRRRSPPKPVRTVLGDLIQAVRVRRGDVLATAAEQIGVRPTTISNWESRGKKPHLGQLRSIADYTRTSLQRVTEMREAIARGGR